MYMSLIGKHLNDTQHSFTQFFFFFFSFTVVSASVGPADMAVSYGFVVALAHAVCLAGH